MQPPSMPEQAGGRSVPAERERVLDLLIENRIALPHLL